jgi:DNA modification methylase
MGLDYSEMMFTDPPYGVDYEGGHFHSGDVTIKRRREKLHGDENADIYARFLPVAVSVVDGPFYMFFADTRGMDVYNSVHSCGCEIHALIVWNKTNAKYAAMNAQYKQRHEPCLYFKPKKSTLRWCGPSDECTVWDIPRDAKNDLHPTQKPTALAARAIRNHTANIVSDFFLGSGTTLIACEQLGRRCRAIEISPGYVAVALQRWADATGKKPKLITTK